MLLYMYKEESTFDITESRRLNTLRAIMEEQDRAYLASLEVDRAKAR